MQYVESDVMLSVGIVTDVKMSCFFYYRSCRHLGVIANTQLQDIKPRCALIRFTAIEVIHLSVLLFQVVWSRIR